MEWKHKKESKWLIVENRKVHCYLCGRKMLKASQRIYDAESGHYSHAICEKEKQLTGTNERRSAVKKIVAGAGVLGLTAVGVDKFTNFGRMSNSVFSSNAKDQTANPELETVITSQGIILPSLTSDPANPVAGQMWYRSDAGVTAHYDSIQNRVVYSSEINNGNVNVTSKGIINGLSVLPNDGTGGFGPDTTLGATSVGEIGSPYTQSSGIQEAFNYSATSSLYSSDTGHLFYPIKFLDGTFEISAPIYYGIGSYASTDSFAISITGIGYMNSALTWVGNTSPQAMITIDPAINNIYIADFDTDTESQSTVPDYGLYWDSAKGTNANAITIMNINNGFGFGKELIHINNAYLCFIYNVTTPNNLYFHGSNNGFLVVTGNQWSGSYMDIGNFSFISLKGIEPSNIKITNASTSSFTVLVLHLDTVNTGIVVSSPIYSLNISASSINSNSTTVGSIQVEANISSLAINGSAVSGALLSNPSSTAVTIGNLIINGLSNFYVVGPFFGTLTSPITVSNYDLRNITNGTFSGTLPSNTPSTPSVPASGTAQENTNPYAVDVYVYGGDVTEIQITRNGTAYTVFSNSTGLALSGQSYKLNPGDSITVTYSTAPSWEWLSD